MKIQLEEEIAQSKVVNCEASEKSNTKDENITKVSSMVSFSEECTISAEPITDYVPKYFEETEMNPACNYCQEPSSQDSMQYLQGPHLP
jgi:hypothetical protein